MSYVGARNPKFADCECLLHVFSWLVIFLENEQVWSQTDHFCISAPILLNLSFSDNPAFQTRSLISELTF